MEAINKFEFDIHLSDEAINQVKAFAEMTDNIIYVAPSDRAGFWIVKGDFDHNLEIEFTNADGGIDEDSILNFLSQQTNQPYTFKSIYIEDGEFGGTAMRFVNGEPIWVILNEVYGL